MKSLSQIADTARITNRAERTIRGKKYLIHYIDSKVFEDEGLNLLGYAYKGKIYMSTNLPKSVERGVLVHETQHVQDTKQWLGKYGKEIRANAFTIAHDPLGFLATLRYSLTRARLKTYWRLYVYPRVHP
jgi:hypothetical protein